MALEWRSMSDTRRYAVGWSVMQRQSHGGPKVQSCRRYACKSNDLIANYDNPRQYLDFNRTDFWYSSSFGVTWPSNLGCFTFGKRILPLTRSRPVSVPTYVNYYFFSFFMWKILESWKLLNADRSFASNTVPQIKCHLQYCTVSNVCLTDECNKL